MKEGKLMSLRFSENLSLICTLYKEKVLTKNYKLMVNQAKYGHDLYFVLVNAHIFSQTSNNPVK